VDDLTIARAIHLLAIVHWIGGLAFVTAVLLPAIGSVSEPSLRLALFEHVEGRFSKQAKASVALAGLSGLYLTHRLNAWERFAEPQFWWMQLMVLLWSVFAFVLFVAERAFLHGWFRRRAARDPVGTFALVRRAHWVLLMLSLVTLTGAALGAHGMSF